MIIENDTRKRRCPRLGHEIAFAYCREPGEKIPCSRIYDCWWEIFDVGTFIRQHYPEDIVTKIDTPPKTKILSLFEMIQQAQKIKKNNEKYD